jgi:hypothetical protein
MTVSCEAGWCGAIAGTCPLLAACGSSSPSGSSPNAGAADAGVEVDAAPFGVGSHLPEGGSPLDGVTR